MAVTKKVILNAIIELAGGIDTVALQDGTEVTGEEIQAYCETTLAQIEAKAVKAAERAAVKKAKGDELYSRVLEYVTEEFQTGDEITAAIGDEEITKPKVVSRLGQAIKNGVVVKEQVKIGDKKQMAYRLA